MHTVSHSSGPKAPVVYAFCVTLVVGLLLLSGPSSHHHGKHKHGNRRRLDGGRRRHAKEPGEQVIKLHRATTEVNPKLDHITFDPLIAEMETKQDDHSWEEAYFREHHEEVHVHTKVEPVYTVGHGTDGHGGKQGHEHGQGSGNESAKHGGHEHEYVHGEEVEDEELQHLHDHMDSAHVESKVNVSSRIRTLFPLIDTDERDGYISLNELAMWQVQQAHRSSAHRTRREMEITDANHDGFISLKEYLQDDSDGDEVSSEWDESLQSFVNLSKQRFPMADTDGDGLLNEEEFNAFLHPEDSHNENLTRSVRDEEFRAHDKDSDGRLSFEEFFESAWEDVKAFDDEYEKWEEHRFAPHPDTLKLPSHGHEQHAQHGHEEHHEHGHHGHHEHHEHHEGHHGHEYGHVEEEKPLEVRREEARRRFQDSDFNDDGFLDVSEFADNLLYALAPNEYHFAEEQAKHMLTQADDNKDKHLSLDEMLRNWSAFYDVVEEHSEPHTPHTHEHDTEEDEDDDHQHHGYHHYGHDGEEDDDDWDEDDSGEYNYEDDEEGHEEFR
ncbi:unnamed protein product [Closterium sp. NIES-64]|nr:unnamed protein product [Closterium sp. Naga37s-1]CAI5973970.1 unnamed protein product [Closterium sp. NIES-65]CAI6007238.1 unnamed protein product [Closterium sp. NIES-64]